MKIIEAMKELKLITKKITKNTTLINTYAAVPDNHRLHFENKQNQVAEIKSLIQANHDLTKQYLNLKLRIEYTNIMTHTVIDNKKYSISELLVIKRVLAQLMISTYKALNENMALRSVSSTRNLEKTPFIEKYYKESDKNDGINFWDNLYQTIDGKLEVVNAITDLLEIPE